MIPLRNKVPQRRANPTRTPTGSNWSQHKPDLQEDFHNHCAYCYSYDGFRHTYFEVDHFVPKSFFKNLGNITLTQYSNLVYSCKFCNNNKLSLWPSKSETVFFNNMEEGFADPCTPDYDTHFYRTADGGIMWATPLGRWMFREAFKFDERQDSIKILWNMNRLRQIIDALIVIMKKHSDTSEEYKTIKIKLGEYSLEYYIFHKELIEFYDK